MSEFRLAKTEETILFSLYNGDYYYYCLSYDLQV